MSRTRIILGVMALLAVGAVLAAHFGRAPVEAALANRYIDAAGMRLNMPETEVAARLGEGEYQYGFGGHGHSYPGEGLLVSIAEAGSLNGRVSELRTSNRAHAIYGVHVGVPGESANTVGSIIIGIHDPALEGAQF